MKVDLTNIKNIVFDLGNVLLDLDFDASIKAFEKLGLEKSLRTPKQTYSDPVFYQLETGKITAVTFREKVRRLLKNPLATDEQIDDAWYAMIGEIPPHRVEVLQALRKKYKVYLFSNTNAIHIGRVMYDFKRRYGFEFASLFDEAFYSHEIKAKKPDVEVFRKVIDLAGFAPDETLFVDDLEQNVEGAKLAGLKVYWLKPGQEMAGLF